MDTLISYLAVKSRCVSKNYGVLLSYILSPLYLALATKIYYCFLLTSVNMHGLAGTPNAFTRCHADVHLLLHGHILISQQPGVAREMRCPIQRPREKYELLGKKKLSTRSRELVWISHPTGEKTHHHIHRLSWLWARE